MKQYIISLVLLIGAPVAFPTSHANAQSQGEMKPASGKRLREGRCRTQQHVCGT